MDDTRNKEFPAEKMQHISMRQLAKDIGVSHSLISLVLNDRWREAKISPKTRDRVLEHLKKINYRPNRLATHLRSNATNSIAVLVPTILGDFYQHILDGIETSLGENFIINLGVSEENSQKEQRLIISLLERRVDGVALVYTGGAETEPLLLELRNKKIPLVLIDRYSPIEKTNYVGSDHFKIGVACTQHLLKAGYSEVVCISHMLRGPSHNTMIIDRLRGYEKVMTDNGLPVRIVERDVVADEIDYHKYGRQAMRQIFQNRTSSLGVFAILSSVAEGALLECKNCGLNVPGDAGIITSDADPGPHGDMAAIPLTTICQQTNQMGRIAGEMLLDMISGKRSTDNIEHVNLDFKLIERLSSQRIRR